MGQPLHIKVFVSSPGDVPDERAAALKLLASLPGEAAWAGRITLQPVMWDDPQAPAPLEANRTPQAAVNWYKGRPADCDLTIVILAGRIGSPPDLYRQDGSRYQSGTVWEYEDAVAGGRKVWVFRRDPPPEIDIDDPALDEKRAQRAGIKAFVGSILAGGKGGVETYANPADFAAKLARRLATYLRARSDETGGKTGSTDTAPSPPYLIPRPDRDHDIIGRADLLDTLWADVAAGHHCSLVFLAGVGKTSVALELVRQKARVLEKFGGVLWADLGKRPERAEQLRLWAQALGIAPARLGQLDGIEEWKRAVAEAIGERRLLLVLDDVWAVKDADEFIELGANCVSLVTTRLPKVAAALSRQDAVKEVEELDDTTGLALLDHLAPHAVAAGPDDARELVASVQGLPLALVLMGKFLRRESDSSDPDRIHAAFATLREAGRRMSLSEDDEDDEDAAGSEDDSADAASNRKRKRTLRAIIEVSYAALRSDAARRALASLAIFRPKPHAFSKEMAKQICQADSKLLYQLSDMGLVENLKAAQPGKRAAASTDELVEFTAPGNYTMHRVIAEFARRQLSPEATAELHRNAVDWYRQRMEKRIEDDTAAYEDWYVYEKAEWQALKNAWLYHLAASGDTRRSMLAFLRLYFDAFWWWGYYQPFPFCQRLIREWLRRDIGPDQREGLRLLGVFQQRYPAGYEKRGRQDDWRAVEESLVALRRKLELDGAPDQIEDKDARRVRYFTDFLLAECAGYGRGERAQALTLYRAAHDQFKNKRIPWIPAWIWFYVAQYLLDEGDPAAAADYARKALAEAGEEQALAKRDPELLANIYRQLGDLTLAAREGDAALQHYRRAAFHAFIFQAVPEDADTYTVDFYREITGRIATQIAACHAAGQTRGRELAEALRAYFEPWWQTHPKPGPGLDEALQSMDTATLEACIFPAVPTAEKVIEAAADFAKQVKAVLPALRAGAAIAGDPVVGDS